MISDYAQAEKYILEIPKFTKKNSVEATKAFYEFLGKPGKESKIIHVAGTNGKGSTCAYMNSVLTEEGYRVGMFTSPHLVTMRERIRLNKEMIKEQDFVDTVNLLAEQIETYQKETKEVGYYPTFFEFLFFLAMLYFEEKKPEIIILETGLGGRLDATNVIESPVVTVITEIGLDHTEYLGNTFEKIAAEKAGIIKKNCPVVYSANRQETSVVIEKKALEFGVLCKSVGKTEKEAYRFVDKKIDFSFFSSYYDCIPIRLNTTAAYQAENARLALTALEVSGIAVSKESMQKGMAGCRWEGRMEEILPKVYIDGAHNEDGIEAFLETVKMDGCRGKRWLLFSAVADKEYEAMKNELVMSGLFSNIYAAPLQNARGLAKNDLERIFAGQKVRITDRACQALEEMVALREKEDLVYVTGSLYLVGEIKEQITLSTNQSSKQ